MDIEYLWEWENIAPGEKTEHRRQQPCQKEWKRGKSESESKCRKYYGVEQMRKKEF